MEQEFQFFSDTDALDEQQTLGDERILKVRLDKWLWAARFFKTRAVVRAAVEAGRVFYNGERSRPSREIEIGALLQIQQGHFQKVVIIKGLSTRRRSTEEALQLFEETSESQLAREQTAFSQRSEQPKERRMVRFLRRSFNRGEPRFEQNKTQTLKHREIEIFD